jgi:hypothetical protein
MSGRRREALKPVAYRPVPPTRSLSRTSRLAGPSIGRNASPRTVAPSAPAFVGHDFGKVRVFSGGRRAAPAVHDQSPAPAGGPGEEATQAPAPAPQPAKTPPAAPEAKEKSPGAPPVVDRVDLVSSSSGAVGGFPQDKDMPGASLNTPGDFNDTWICGAVANIHQVHFHVASGWPANLRAARVVKRTALRRGQQLPHAGHDGPPLHEYQFTKDKMVIADAPGWYKTLQMEDFPVNYKADFSLYAFDPLDNRIAASISYRVEIEKTHYTQPDPINKVQVTGVKIGGAVPPPVKAKPKSP